MAMPTSAAASAGASLTPSRGHRDLATLPVKFVDQRLLVLRQHAGAHIVDPELLGDCTSRRLVVAGGHDDGQARSREGHGWPQGLSP
jgi:hypothetical protein